jgi:YHS domain-containing protein
VVGDRPASTAETANPFDRTAESDEWRSAESTPTQKIVSPEEKPAAPKVAAPETRTKDPANSKQNSKTTEIASSNKPKSEQIGADRPVSVLDVLANNLGEPAASARAINTAKTPARAPIADLPAARSATIEHEASAVIANGLPRSIRSDSSSQHPLESIPDAGARLSTPPSDDVAIHEAPRTEQQKLDARNGRDGFMGFCPVTLRDQKTLVDGNPQFTSSYANERFEFASAEAKAAFDSDPVRYSPAHAGRYIVRAAGHTAVSGALLHATYQKNRLYLFRSEQTCRLFEADPARYVVEDDGR